MKVNLGPFPVIMGRWVSTGLKAIPVICLVAFAALSLIGLSRGLIVGTNLAVKSLKQWWNTWLRERPLNAGLQRWIDQANHQEEKRARRDSAEDIRSCFRARSERLMLRQYHEVFPVEVLRHVFPQLNLLQITTKTLPEWILEVEHLVGLECNLLEEHEIPDQFRPVFERLRYLRISAPNLKKLPEWLVKSENLQRLLILNSKLEEFPVRAENFPNLRECSISSSKMRLLSIEKGGFRRLESLSIRNTPMECVEFQAGVELSQLRDFRAIQCRLEQLVISPQEAPFLVNLYLDENRLKEVPQGLERFQALEVFSAINNRLTNPVNLFKLRPECRVWISGNSLTADFIQKVRSYELQVWRREIRGPHFWGV